MIFTNLKLISQSQYSEPIIHIGLLMKRQVLGTRLNALNEYNHFAFTQTQSEMDNTEKEAFNTKP
jgi:hypothetical protein